MLHIIGSQYNWLLYLFYCYRFFFSIACYLNLVTLHLSFVSTHFLIILHVLLINPLFNSLNLEYKLYSKFFMPYLQCLSYDSQWFIEFKFSHWNLDVDHDAIQLLTCQGLIVLVHFPLSRTWHIFPGHEGRIWTGLGLFYKICLRFKLCQECRKTRSITDFPNFLMDLAKNIFLPSSDMKKKNTPLHNIFD